MGKYVLITVGPTKPAVIVFGHSHVNAHLFRCHLARASAWNHHVGELLGGGEHKMAVYLFWTSSLPLSFEKCIYQTYVHPSVAFGLELTPAGLQIARIQKRTL